ncbi:hypothetical protein RJ639_017169 [Escallonia herrerae]|uniref:Uncharacterized protein n=1 Tax=Escallonia herrerae TaxID=1293975 RepID=A0AA88VFZ5_9ASTE|nr:hypothetical protein RJ639_017169 [Escallonia herrerae]
MPSYPISKLSKLDIASNLFSGNIPPNIAISFPGLKALTLSANCFTVPIPSSLGDMASLEYLDLSHNLLSGNIPSSFAMGCRSLESLRLSNNNLQGSILPARHNLTMLRSLELDVNNFTTNPNSLSSCYNLVVLNINLNHHDGPFPTAICQPNNNIASILPACFSPPDIEYVQLSKNRLQGLQGPSPRAFFDCTNIRVLDLSHNQLTGPIPNWFDSLSSLIILVGLIHGDIILEEPIKYENVYVEELIQIVTKSIPRIPRSLSGTIPITVANLTGTENLDLSYNRLTGNIPSQLANLDSLQVFNVSFKYAISFFAESLLLEIAPTQNQLR